MRRLLAGLAVSAVSLLAPPQSTAGVDPSAPVGSDINMQLVVMEAEGCTYCGLFRRDVLPAYQTSVHAKDVPVRFLDVNDVEKSNLALDTPIAIVPTFVVVKDNREVGRIPGYTGPENFFHAIKYLISSAP